VVVGQGETLNVNHHLLVRPLIRLPACVIVDVSHTPISAHWIATLSKH
jgi:hypothetical protein